MCNCSDIDDIIIFYRDGKYKVVRVADKIFVGKNVMHLQVFKKNDKRTIYNVVYRDGKEGISYIKRFYVATLMRDREYDLGQGTPGTKILYFTANPNGEAEVIKVTLEMTAKRKRLGFEKDFSEVGIKGKNSKGNILTKFAVSRISLKSHGNSTLGGRKVWFDNDVKRLNYDEHGRLLGEFTESDFIFVLLDNHEFYITNFDANNHYEDNIVRLEKWERDKVWTAVLYDAENNNYPYIKRFKMEATKRHQSFMGGNPKSKLILLTDEPYPRFKVTFGGDDAFREPMEIEAADFIGVKGFKAKGKRIATWNIDRIEELEPLHREPPAEEKGDNTGDDADGAQDNEVRNDNPTDPEGRNTERHDEPQQTHIPESLFPDEYL